MVAISQDEEAGKGLSLVLKHRKEKPPLIVVNGVTYSTETAMPEDIRREWQKCVAEMQAHGADLRNAKRIVFDVTKDGQNMTYSCKVEAHPRIVKQRIGPWGVAFSAYIGLVVGLVFLGMGWVGPYSTIPNDDPSFFTLFLTLYAPMFLLLIKARRSPEFARKKPLSRYAHLIVAVLAVGLLCHGAVFGGLPKALHYAAEKDNGVIVATVTDKYDFRSKYRRCKPRIALDAIFFPDDICVNKQFFDRAQIGDRVRLVGRKSQFAIEPVNVELIGG
jgi:hypothetical protein